MAKTCKLQFNSIIYLGSYLKPNMYPISFLVSTNSWGKKHMNTLLYKISLHLYVAHYI